MPINIAYKKFTPSEIYTVIPENEELNLKDKKYMVDVNSTGIEFLDIFFKIIRRYGKIRVEQIAKIMQIDIRGLRYTVFTLTGVNVHDWVIQYVFMESCELLAKTNLSLIEIAKRVGFNSTSAFTQFFMRMQPLAPGEWRRVNRMK